MERPHLIPPPTAEYTIPTSVSWPGLISYPLATTTRVACALQRVAVRLAICLIVAALALGMAVKGHSLAPNRTRTSGIRLTVGTSLITIATTALCWGRTLHWGVVAGTAISLRCLRLAVRRFFANQGTFGLLTVRRAVALPVAAAPRRRTRTRALGWCTRYGRQAPCRQCHI